MTHDIDSMTQDEFAVIIATNVNEAIDILPSWLEQTIFESAFKSLVKYIPRRFWHAMLHVSDGIDESDIEIWKDIFVEAVYDKIAILHFMSKETAEEIVDQVLGILIKYMRQGYALKK